GTGGTGGTKAPGAPPQLAGLPPAEATGKQGPGTKVSTTGGKPAPGSLIAKANDEKGGDKPKIGGLPDLPPAPPPAGDKQEPAPAAVNLPPVTAGSGGTTTPATAPLRPVPVPTPLPPAPAVATAPPKPEPTVPTFEVKGTNAGKPARVAAGTSGTEKRPEPIVVPGTPTASAPPLPVPSTPAAIIRAAQPDVISYSEETYTAGAGDTFTSISRARYNTDRYAHALYLFNRSHPLAEDDLAPDAPLNTKQKIYIPPAEILEARYPDQIPSAAPAAAAPAVTVGASPARSAPPPAPTAGPRTYRVGASGELEYDIARNLLGDGNRWVEIYKLNPGWLPEKPIPAGTTLTLPADARLP
ncbi:MAG: hypothetical protein ACHQ5A_15250, partial [Opitutales bacterium]